LFIPRPVRILLDPWRPMADVGVRRTTQVRHLDVRMCVGPPFIDLGTTNGVDAGQQVANTGLEHIAWLRLRHCREECGRCFARRYGRKCWIGCCRVRICVCDELAAMPAAAAWWTTLNCLSVKIEVPSRSGGGKRR
ncbi:hypothetical protein CI238_06027, partial [Colletotrichum incanum]